MRAAIILCIACAGPVVLAQKPPQHGAPNVPPRVLASLQHGLTQKQVEDLLKARGNHQFTAVTSNGTARCVSFYRNDVFGHYHLVFLNDRLIKISRPPPFETRKDPYKGTVSVRRVLGDPEARLDAVLQSEDMIGPQLSAALTPQPPPRHSWDPGLTTAFWLAQRTANKAALAERERQFADRAEQFDPLAIDVGSSLNAVEKRLGKPQVTESLEANREIRFYGTIEFGLIEQMWISIVYEEGKVIRVFTRDFFDRDKVRSLESQNLPEKRK